MLEEKRLKVEVKTSEQSVSYPAKILVFTKSDAMRKALKVYAATLFMAFVTAFIPIVHFIAVPGFLIIGPIISLILYRFYNGQKDIVVENPECPSCHCVLKISPVLTSWPLQEICANCGVPYSCSYFDTASKNSITLK